MSEIKELNFKTNVLIKNILGKELINNDNIAIMELVKNSFDALSKNVIIEFKNIKSNDDHLIQPGAYTNNTSKIIIRDFGIGMDSTDIENKWLNIAYSDKKKVKSKHGRLMAGAKGVGRFSCDRLGQFLDIYSKKSKSTYYHLKIDWKDFEIESDKDAEINQIKLKLEILSNEEFISQTGYTSFENGTILEISKLHKVWSVYNEKKKKWNVDSFLDLRKHLEKLINPNQAYTSDSFEIKLLAKEFHSDNKLINSPINNPIFQKLNFRTTSIEAIVENGTIISTLKDKGQEIFILEELNNLIHIKNCKTKLTLYYLNPYSKGYFKKETGTELKNYGSIYLFLNGFRIPPYGEPNNDWLGLEVRKGQGYARNLGTREVIGQIEIIDEEEKFRIISSREGLVNNDAYLELTKQLFMKIFTRLEKFVVNGLKWDSTIHEDKNIEKLIENDPEWDITKERYKETEDIKSRRIFESLKSIINVTNKNVVDFTISEDLIKRISAQQKEKVEKEYQKLLQKFTNSNESRDALIKFFEEQTQIDKKIQDQIKQLNKYKLTEKSKIAIESINDVLKLKDSYLKEINIYKEKADKAEKNNKSLFELTKELERKNALIEKERQKLIKQNKQLEEEHKKEVNKRKIAEKEANSEREKAKREKEKNTYLLADKTINTDTHSLIHNIKITSAGINASIDNIIYELQQPHIDKLSVINKISRIKYNNDKVLAYSKLISKADFKSDKFPINIPKYINEYLGLNTRDFSMNYHSNGLINESFIRNINIVELSMVLDNLISNSKKALAKTIIVDTITTDPFTILIADDGKGLHHDFVNNPEIIFDLGITNTDGSGIGLFTVRDLLSDMNASIEYTNSYNYKGACFKIIFK
ncbi:ATP-binding protein [Marinifilum flexuosum]|uniref:ATP-binding protein n=1 Tax=Marinifilum flexuosum TaxID=1117708 RepID=UPI0024942408|nr:ATP-binding protein [Marinifilum flexuosum]